MEPYLLLPLALVLFLMALPILSRKLHGPVTFIETRQLSELLDAGEQVVVFDLRGPGDFAAGHVKGAVNLPSQELKSRLEEPRSDLGAERSDPIALVCQSDLRAIKANKTLRAHGFERVAVLKGGMLKWQRDKLPTVTG